MVEFYIFAQVMYSNTWDISACIKLPTDVKMVMPGEAATVQIILRKPMVAKEGQRFTIRENNLTAVTGLITKTLPSSDLKLVGFNWERPRCYRTEGNAWLTMKRRRK